MFSLEGTGMSVADMSFSAAHVTPEVVVASQTPLLSVSSLTLIVFFTALVVCWLAFELEAKFSSKLLARLHTQRLPTFRLGVQLGAVLVFVFAVEKFPLFPHANKTGGSIMLVGAFVPFALMALVTMRRSPSADASSSGMASALPLGGARGSLARMRAAVAPAPAQVSLMSREQTEEWKGWMQFCFVMYHYLGALELYKPVRLMISSYVWLTGFGNASFFCAKSDYSFSRVLHMLWRINISCILLTMTMGTSYILYYVCALHSFYFLFSYVIMRINRSWNFTPYGLRLKLALAFVLVALVWDFIPAQLFTLCFAWMGGEPMLGASHGMTYEWFFRTALDHYSCLFGMMFALNLPMLGKVLSVVEALPTARRVMSKLVMAGLFLLAVAGWALQMYPMSKLQYNQMHAYTVFLPITGYVLMRNLSPWLREHHSEMLRRLGTISLEAYLLQHHIFLADNARFIVTVVPGMPWFNMLVVGFVYILVAQRLFELTNDLREKLLPSKLTLDTTRPLVVAAAMFTASRLLAMFISFEPAVSAVLLLGVGGGLSLGTLVLVSFYLRDAWEDVGALPLTLQDASIATPVAEKRADMLSWKPTCQHLLGGVVCVLAVASTIWAVSFRGAPRLEVDTSGAVLAAAPPLALVGAPRSLLAVQQGMVALPSFARMESESELAQLAATCSQRASVGAWEGDRWRWAAAASQCTLKPLTAVEVRNTFDTMPVAILGDSQGRLLFHAVARSMGLDSTDPAECGTHCRHATRSAKAGTAKVRFSWAPFARNLTSNLVQGGASTLGNAPRGLLVLLSGAWDALHVASPEDFRKEMHALRSELMNHEKDRVIVWVDYPAVHDSKLPTDEKRARVDTKHMAVYRKIAAEELAPVVHARLDAEALTQGAAQWSRDGIHHGDNVENALAQALVHTVRNSPRYQQYRPTTVHVKPSQYRWPGLALVVVFTLLSLATMDNLFGISWLVLRASLTKVQLTANFEWHRVFPQRVVQATASSQQQTQVVAPQTPVETA